MSICNVNITEQKQVHIKADERKWQENENGKWTHVSVRDQPVEQDLVFSPSKDSKEQCTYSYSNHNKYTNRPLCLVVMCVSLLSHIHFYMSCYMTGMTVQLGEWKEGDRTTVFAEVTDEEGRKNTSQIVLYAFYGLNRIMFPSYGRPAGEKREVRLLADKSSYEPGDVAHVRTRVFLFSCHNNLYKCY